MNLPFQATARRYSVSATHPYQPLARRSFLEGLPDIRFQAARPPELSGILKPISFLGMLIVGALGLIRYRHQPEVQTQAMVSSWGEELKRGEVNSLSGSVAEKAIQKDLRVRLSGILTALALEMAFDSGTRGVPYSDVQQAGHGFQTTFNLPLTSGPSPLIISDEQMEALWPVLRLNLQGFTGQHEQTVAILQMVCRTLAQTYKSNSPAAQAFNNLAAALPPFVTSVTKTEIAGILPVPIPNQETPLGKLCLLSFFLRGLAEALKRKPVEN